MLEFQKPNIQITDVNADKTYGKFVVEQLERGYATTLGNSLRRIMLSSLPGSAITSVKIEGVLHEFTSIEGVSEDVLEIILNLKKIVFKLHDNGPKTVYIQAKGEKEVTGADSICDSEVEVLNPEAHIASLMSGGEINMSMTVETGRGYSASEKNKKEDMPIGTIPVDSIYTPCLLYTSMLLMPAGDGTGVIAGGPARAVLELAGISDIRTKSLGSNNANNMVKATLQGLSSLVSAQQVAAKRGKSVEEILS